MSGLIAALSVDQLAVRRRMEELEGQVARGLAPLPGIAREVANLALQIAALGPDKADGLVLWDWAAMNAEQAAEAWNVLADWVTAVLIGVYRLVEDGTAPHRPEPEPVDRPAYKSFEAAADAKYVERLLIPGCWMHHPDVVAELSWLCQMWLDTYRTPGANWGRVGDWHDRYLPGAVRRIKDMSTAQACTIRHVAPAPAGAVNADQLSAAIQADLRRRAVVEGE